MNQAITILSFSRWQVVPDDNRADEVNDKVDSSVNSFDMTKAHKLRIVTYIYISNMDTCMKNIVDSFIPDRRRSVFCNNRPHQRSRISSFLLLARSAALTRSSLTCQRTAILLLLLFHQRTTSLSPPSRRKSLTSTSRYSPV